MKRRPKDEASHKHREVCGKLKEAAFAVASTVVAWAVASLVRANLQSPGHRQCVELDGYRTISAIIRDAYFRPEAAFSFLGNGEDVAGFLVSFSHGSFLSVVSSASTRREKVRNVCACSAIEFEAFLWGQLLTGTRCGLRDAEGSRLRLKGVCRLELWQESLR